MIFVSMLQKVKPLPQPRSQGVSFHQNVDFPVSSSLIKAHRECLVLEEAAMAGQTGEFLII